MSTGNSRNNIKGEYLNHPRLTHIIIILEIADELQEMLSDLNRETTKVGLKVK